GGRVDSAIMGAQNAIVLVARFAALAVGGYLVLHGQVTAGTLIAFLSYVGGLFGPIQNLSNVYRTARSAGVSLDVLLDVIDAVDLVPDAPGAQESPSLRGEVHFENVRFEYEEGRPVLNGVDLHVRPGERVALVGPSGGGKTTLMALLQRLYDPGEG